MVFDAEKAAEQNMSRFVVQNLYEKCKTLKLVHAVWGYNPTNRRHGFGESNTEWEHFWDSGILADFLLEIRVNRRQGCDDIRGRQSQLLVFGDAAWHAEVVLRMWPVANGAVPGQLHCDFDNLTHIKV